MPVVLTDVADVLRAAGLPVIEVPGWKTRGVPDMRMGAIQGGLVHHTAGPATGVYPSLRTVRDGRADLEGPLAQLGLGRDGTWYAIAAGYCNHAGKVGDQRYSNAHALGVECENTGSQPWPQVQYASLVAGCRALGAHYSITWRGHKEAAIPAGRKVDPNLDMNALRAAIAAPPQEDTVTPQDIEAIADRVVEKLGAIEVTYQDDAQGVTGSRQTLALVPFLQRIGRVTTATQNWVRSTGAKLTAGK